MKRIHRSRSFTPAVNSLEGRLLLSGASGKAAIHGGPLATTATEVVVTDQGMYNKKTLMSVELMATVKPVSGTGVPTGTVTFEMVMPAKKTKMGMNMAMKSGTTVLGTVALTNGEAMLTVKPKMALKMPLEYIYSGSTTYSTSSAMPAELTKAGLKGMSMGMSSSSSGMKM